jgi:hypothetical protein
MARVGAVEFRVLGSFEVLADGRRATPSAPKLRQALLVLEHNKIVHTHNLIDELWGESPPRQSHENGPSSVPVAIRGLVWSLPCRAPRAHLATWRYAALR